jgi:hypothetical protein
VATLLSEAGLSVSEDGEGWQVPLGPDELRIIPGDGHDVLEVEAAPATGRVAAGPGRLLAIGLATVDHERLASELGAGDVVEAGVEPGLGATAWLVPATRLLLLEPSTEGRLAAALARHGEGPIALYLTVDDRRVIDLRRRRGGTLLEPSAVSGPFIVMVTRSRGG